jgi:hypothetical protein
VRRVNHEARSEKSNTGGHYLPSMRTRSLDCRYGPSTGRATPAAKEINPICDRNRCPDATRLGRTRPDSQTCRESAELFPAGVRREGLRYLLEGHRAEPNLASVRVPAPSLLCFSYFSMELEASWFFTNRTLAPISTRIPQQSGSGLSEWPLSTPLRKFKLMGWMAPSRHLRAKKVSVESHH